MEFAAMKRRDLLELCRLHGVATRGSKADLAAALAGTLSLQGAAAAAKSVLGVAVGKGCLKRLGGSASDGTSGASKKVRFALDETSEVKGRRRRSQVILPLVVAKTRGRRKARKALPSAAVSGRGRRRKRNVGGSSAHESVTREVDADAPVTRSRVKVVCLHAPSDVETGNNPAEAEEGGEVVGTATGRKQKRKAHENAEVAANSQAGISRRITRSLSLSAAAVLLPPDAEEKRGGRKVGDSNDELTAEEEAAGVQDLTIAASPVITESSNSSRKAEDCIPSVQESFEVVLSCRTTRLSSVAADVILPTVVGKKRRKTRGRPKAREALRAAARGSQQKCDVGGDSVDHGAFREVCADAPVKQSGTKAVNLCAESQNNPDEAEEEDKAVEADTYRKQKRKIQENSEDTCANASSGISHSRMRRKSISSPPAVLLSSVVEKMEGEKQQVVVACKLSQHRRSSRNRHQADELLRNTDLENNKLRRVPVGGKDLSIAHRLTRNTAKTKLEDVESLSSGFKDRNTRNYKDNVTRNGGRVSLSDDNGNKASAAETTSLVLDERTKGIQESVRKEFQNAKGGDVGKQPAVRRSTRKSKTSVQI